jgi:hypothetical protein
MSGLGHYPADALAMKRPLSVELMNYSCRILPPHAPFWRFANFKAHQQRFIKVSGANGGNGASDAIACVPSHSCDMGCPGHNSDNWSSGKTARTNRGLK